MFEITCAWPCGCMSPPITPNASHGSPSFTAKPGMMVWNGRLPRRIDVGVAVCQREELAAILEHEAEPVGHEPEPMPR